MLVSVIVPTHHRFVTFQRCISSLFNQSLDYTKYEVIAVHDGEDHDYDLSRWNENYPNFRFLTIPKSGVSEARNRAIQECRGDYILMIDDDCIASRTWIEVLTTFMQTHPELSATGGQVLSVDPETFIQEYIKFKNLLRRPVKNIKGEVVTLITANVCYRREVLEKIGYYDEKYNGYYGHEDQDIGLTLRKHGYTRSAPQHMGTLTYHLGKNYADNDRSWNVIGHNTDLFVSKWGFDPRQPKPWIDA